MNQVLIKTRGQQTFFGKGQVAIILGFVEQTVPTDTTQPSTVAREHEDEGEWLLSNKALFTKSVVNAMGIVCELLAKIISKKNTVGALKLQCIWTYKITGYQDSVVLVKNRPME